MALHYVFNAPQDKILWDVGHQVSMLPSLVLSIYKYWKTFGPRVFIDISL